MEHLDLPSSIVLVWDLKRTIEIQKSVKMGLIQFNERQLKTKFAIQVKKWTEQLKNGQQKDFSFNEMTLHQRITVELMIKGISGMSIYEHLVELNANMIQCCEDDIEKHVSTLPLILQIPLLGLLFPAILMLLIVPAIKMLNL